MTTAVITMAGFGRRFLDAGYKVPKYRIEAHGRTLFAWSMLSLASFIEAGATFIFIARTADEAEGFIRQEAQKLSIESFEIVELPTPTDGQATTAMMAKAAVAAPGAPMLVYNIDTFVHPSALPAGAVRGDGWVPCFAAEGDAWSFVALDAAGRAVEVREKRRISPHATIGLYWFRSFDAYADLYRRYYSDGGGALEAGERYIAPLYNQMIADGGAVYIHDVPVSAVVPLGVPADVERFKAGQAPGVAV
ncbi:MAG: hypothetical protein AB7O04_16540 [Hyphomonadaceae bacterium]